MRLRCCGMTLNSPFMLENPPMWLLKAILQRRVGQNPSTAMWKTHGHLSQILVCSCCCEGWHNQLLDLPFHIVPGRFGQFFSINKWNRYFKTAFCIYSGYLCVILNCVWWSESFKWDKYAKTKKQALFTALYVYWYSLYQCLLIMLLCWMFSHIGRCNCVSVFSVGSAEIWSWTQYLEQQKAVAAPARLFQEVWLLCFTLGRE